jgi:hypothetical protein
MKHGILLTSLFFVPISKAMANPTEGIGETLNSLSIIEQQARALDLMGGLSQNISKSSSAPLTTLGLSHDKIRSANQLSAAASHLVLDDTAKAMELARNGYLDTNESDNFEATNFLKVIYESERKQGLFLDAARSCSRLMARGPQPLDLILSCAHTMTQAARKTDSPKPRLARETLNAFAYSPSVRSVESNSLQPAILISQAFISLGLTKESYDYLARSVANSRSTVPWRTRAQLTLALLDWFSGFQNKAQSSLLELAKSTSTDDLTRLHATIAFARILALRGMNEAAETQYRAALQLARNLPESLATNPLAVGELQFKVPTQESNVYSLVERAQLQAEFANHLCIQGNTEGCAKEYEKIPEGIPQKEHIDLLVRSGHLKGKALDQASRLLTYAQTDLSWIARQKQLSVPLPLPELHTRSYTLLEIAKTYGAEEDPTVAGLASLYRSFRNIEQEAARSRNAVLNNLAALSSSSEASDSKHLKYVFARVESLGADLSHSLLALDISSFEHWNAGDSAFVAAQSHRAALLSRMESLSDTLSQMARGIKQNNENRSIHSFREHIVEVTQSSTELKGQLAAVAFLSSLNKEKTNVALTPSLAQESLELEKNTLQTTLDAHIALLKNPVSTPLSEHLKQISQSAEELRKLHAEHSRPPQNTAEALSLTNINMAWSRFFSALTSLQNTLGSTVERSKTQRENTAKTILNIVNDSKVVEKDLASIATSLQPETQIALAKAAESLYRKAQSVQNRLRLAVATADIQRISESEEGKQQLDRAAAERSRWIESLRTSLKWGLAR